MRELPRASGLTLTELMATVAVVAVLASIAHTTWTGYRRRSYAIEGETNVYLIAAAQGAYRAEFGQYANVKDFNPVSTECLKRTDWDAAVPAVWTQFGWEPENKWGYCQYKSEGGDDDEGGAADDGVPPAWAATLIPASVRAAGWYTAVARCDLDCGVATKTRYRLASTKSNLIRMTEYTRADEVEPSQEQIAQRD